MSVYVDPLFGTTPYRKSENERWNWQHACHLIADTEEELHAFASRLGLQRAWFQPKSSPHYDLTANKRAQALRLGAVEVTPQRLAEINAQKRTRKSGIRVLSIQQPWAWLVVHGLKDIENRDWTTGYRGNLLIHAGQKFDPYALDWIASVLDSESLKRLLRNPVEYERGGIVGVVKFTRVVTARDEESASPWFQGPYGWYFERAKPLPFFSLKGQLGLWEPHPAVLAAMKREVGVA